MQSHQLANKSTYVSIFVNIVLAILQIIVGFFSFSQSLIADGFHTVADLVSDFVVLIARKQSQKDADEDHPYGHHRYENMASLFLGVLLVTVAVGMVYSSILKIKNPETVGSVKSIALWMALITLACKEILFRYMISIAEKLKSSLLAANAWHARSDAASSLVAAIGIFGNMMGYHIFDPLAALIVGLVVGKMGLKFTWNSLHDLMDRTADEETLAHVRATLLATDGIQGVHDLRARKMGDMLIIDVHLEIDGNLTVRQGHDIAIRARENVLANHHVLNVMTHVDPV